MTRKRTYGRLGDLYRSEYTAWLNIRRWCLNPTHKSYPYYGGRGITVDPAWAKSFAAFISAVGQKPSPELWLCRVDLSKGYEPGNVVWGHRAVQMPKRRSALRVEVDGVLSTVCASKYLKRAHSAWKAMQRRCLEPRHSDYPLYGGLGIRVCPQWRVSFDQFVKDMGLPPSSNHWLGRLDVRAHYTPDNCVWTLQAPQEGRRAFCKSVIVAGERMTPAAASRLPGQPTRETVLRRWEDGLSLAQPKLAKVYRRSKWLTHQGETLPLPVWAKRVGMRSQVLWHRIHRGMSIERALDPTPMRRHQ